MWQAIYPNFQCSHILGTKFIQGIRKKNYSHNYKSVLANELNLVTFDSLLFVKEGMTVFSFNSWAKLFKYRFESWALSPRKFNTIIVCSENHANPTYKFCEWIGYLTTQQKMNMIALLQWVKYIFMWIFNSIQFYSCSIISKTGKVTSQIKTCI
jgi:hypothetical protein